MCSQTMAAIIIDVIQRTAAWFQIRSGNVGGSQAESICSTLKSGRESARRRDLRTQLSLERVLGHSIEPQDGYVSEDMQRGLDLEMEAVTALSEHIGLLIRPVGWIQDTSRRAGVSPDGIAMGSEDDALVEAKAPRPGNHLSALRLRGETGLDAIPARNRSQLLHALAVSSFPSVCFASFCPLFPEGLRLYSYLLTRESVSEELAVYSRKLDVFLSEVSDEESEIRRLMCETTKENNDG
jgi:hypothetical protein